MPQLLADAPLVILVLSSDLRIINANDAYLVSVLRPRWLSGSVKPPPAAEVGCGRAVRNDGKHRRSAPGSRQRRPGHRPDFMGEGARMVIADIDMAADARACADAPGLASSGST